MGESTAASIVHMPQANNALAPVVPHDKIQLLIDTVAPGLSKPQLSLFVTICNRVRLDPFARQIYAIVRNEWDAETRMKKPKMTIQTGIDGYRTIAERTGESDGGALHEWCGPEGVWRDIWLEEEPPAAARATVHRKGRRPTVMTARWGAYVQTKQDGSATKMWTQRGPEQLAKCAEALALRAAYPDTMEGVYTSEEMAQADNDREHKPLPAAEQVRRIAAPKGPVFGAKWNKAWASKPVASAPADVVAEYMSYLEGVAADPERQRFHKAVLAHLEEIAPIFDKLMQDEHDKACAPADPVAVALQAQIDAKAAGDKNPAWGMDDVGDQPDDQPSHQEALGYEPGNKP